MRLRPLAIAVWIATASACSTPSPVGEVSPALPVEESEGATFVVCKEPRPEACTYEMRPVCAHTMGGLLETRPNGCQACSDPEVLGHRAGACR